MYKENFMSTETVLAITQSTLKPLQSHSFPTPNGTSMTLTLNNLSVDNSCGWSVSCPGVVDDSGTLEPLGNKVFGPTDYQGKPLKVQNTTTPTKPADLHVTLF